MIWTAERKQMAQASLDAWQGTPHRDRIAIRGVGVDCIHLVQAVLFDAGIIPAAKLPWYDLTAGMTEECTALKRAMVDCLFVEEVSKDAPAFGDIAIFKTGRRSGHCGFVVPDFLWHSLAQRCVTRSNYDQWLPRLDCLLRITGDGFRRDITTYNL